jgi:uncharacterized protein YegP (UPF0339 family)
MRKPKIIIKKAGKKKGECMVVVKAANGKVLMTSEILSSVRNAFKNIKAWYYKGIDVENHMA